MVIIIGIMHQHVHQTDLLFLNSHQIVNQKDPQLLHDLPQRHQIVHLIHLHQHVNQIRQCHQNSQIHQLQHVNRIHLHRHVNRHHDHIVEVDEVVAVIAAADEVEVVEEDRMSSLPSVIRRKGNN